MLKNDVLQMLQASDGSISGEEMSAKLGVTRAAIWKAVQALRNEGVEIDSATNRGYHIRNAGLLLNQQKVAQELGEHPWSDRVVVMSEVTSTNTVLKEQALAGAPNGTVLIADCQTGGKGRLGRQFVSPAGVGVYLSLLLRPKAAPTALTHLTSMTAVAVSDAIEKVCGTRPKIKWTNDLVLGKHKICGILTEMSLEAESGSVQYAIIGIGVNCNNTAEHFPEDVKNMASSLAMATGKPVERSKLAAEIIRSLYRMHEELFSGKAEWMARYARDCITIGQDVKIVRGDEIRYARALGIDEDAGLLVEYLDDHTRGTVSSGEVSVRGMYGYL